MANIAVEKRLIGGLDTDTNLQLVQPLDYIDAYNCQNVNKYDRNHNFDIFPMGGNEYKFFLPSVALQKKSIRIFVEIGQDPASLPAGGICDIGIFTQNGVLIGTINLTTTNSPNIAAMATQIQTQAAAFTPTFDISASATTLTGNPVYFGIIDITFNQFFADEVPEDYSIQITGNVQYGFITKDENLTKDITGELKVVGRFPLADDLFLWATTVRKVDFGVISIVSVTNIPVTAENANAEIITSTPHGLFTGQQIIISNPNSGSIRGIWLVVVIDDFTIQLVNSAYQAYSVPSFNFIKKYVSGYGSILHAKRNANGVWQGTQTTQTVATKLIGAKQLNLSTLHGVDAVVKKNNFQTKFKFGDNFNPYRFMTYKGDYKTDGFLANPLTNTDGYYYDTIGESTKLLIGDTSVKITNVQEVIGGGGLTTKNYVFYARLVDNDFTKTPFSYPSNPYSLIKQDTSDVSSSNIFAFNGDDSAEPTGKAIQVSVGNIPAGAYKYLEIAVIEYRLGSFLGYLMPKIPLSAFQTSATVTVANYLGATDLDVIDLNRLYLSIKRGLNIVDMDNRTVLSNVRLGIDPDLTEVARNIVVGVVPHALQKKQTLNGTNPLEFGEFELPDNILRYTGYHFWDTVRVGVRYKLKGGNWTKVYHIKDQNIRQGLDAGGYDYSLTSGSDAYTYLLELTNHDLDYLVNGVRLRDLIEDFQFVRAEINSEVIASGVVIVSDPEIPLSGIYLPKYNGTPPAGGFGRRIVFFYSPDLLLSNSPSITWQQGDRLINLGNASLENTYTPTSITPGEIYEYSGDLTPALINLQNLEIIDMINYYNFAANSTQAFPNNPGISVRLDDRFLPNNLFQQCLVFLLDSTISSITTHAVTGFYNCHYIRPKGDLYPKDVSLSTYIPIWGVATDVQNDTTSTIYLVAGGDTFTGKNYRVLRNYDSAASTLPNGAAFGFYSQSKNNTQIAKFIFPGLDFSVPYTAMSDLLLFNYFANFNELTSVRYDKSFSILNLINTYPAFNNLVSEQEEAIATIFWSEQSLEDTNKNNDRYFLPLNQRAIDATAGEIVHMIKVNDILYTLQKLRTERQYFDNTQMLTSVTSAEILLGTGRVMGLKGDFKSQYGCSNKWSVHYGTSEGGRNTFYYVDAINRKIIRVGDDGTVVISDRAKLSVWAMKGLLFAANQQTPFDNYGLHSGWDEKSSQLYITSRTFRTIIGEWDIYYDEGYQAGDQVINGYFYGLNDAPVIYQCIQYNLPTVDNEPQTGVDWEQYWEIIPFNIDNYNFWTLVWSEAENRFKWWVSPRPKTWIAYKETLLSPSPIDESNIFEHTELGEEAHWYCRDMGYDVTGVVSGNTLDTSESEFRILEDGFYRILEDGVSKRLLESSGTGANPIPTQTIWGETIWYLVDSNGNQYQILSIVDGVITVDSDLPIDENTYSVKTCVFEEPYIENVVNENQGKKVKFVFTKYNSTKAPKKVEYKTNLHQSFLDKSELENVDEYYTSPIKIDTTNSPNDNETDASELFGKYLRVKTFLGVKVMQKLNSFVVKMREMNPLINK